MVLQKTHIVNDEDHSWGRRAVRGRTLLHPRHVYLDSFSLSPQIRRGDACVSCVHRCNVWRFSLGLLVD